MPGENEVSGVSRGQSVVDYHRKLNIMLSPKILAVTGGIIYFHNLLLSFPFVVTASFPFSPRFLDL